MFRDFNDGDMITMDNGDRLILTGARMDVQLYPEVE